MSTVLLALAAGAVVGLALGGLGGGGSMLAVPALIYLIGLTPGTATTASLLIVATTSLTALVAHARAGRVRWREGLLFGAAGLPLATLGGALSRHLPAPALTTAFALLAGLAAWRMLAGGRRASDDDSPDDGTLPEPARALPTARRSAAVAELVPATAVAAAPTGVRPEPFPSSTLSEPTARAPGTTQAPDGTGAGTATATAAAPTGVHLWPFPLPLVSEPAARTPGTTSAPGSAGAGTVTTTAAAPTGTSPARCPRPAGSGPAARVAGSGPAARVAGPARRAACAGAGLGATTGLLGVGGGFLAVPALVSFLGFPMAEAVGTSLLVITLNSLAALLPRIGGAAEVPWSTVGPFAAAAVLGAWDGKRLAAKLSGRTLQRLFAGALLAVAALMLVDAVL